METSIDRQNPQNVFFQASCKKFAKSITSVCIFVKARNGIWNTKSGKKTGRYCNKFQFQFSIHINLYIKKLKLKKKKRKQKTKKIPKQIMQHTTLWYPYNTFYFPLCCHVDTCFFRILFVLLWLFLVSVSLIVHIYKQQLKLKTQIKYQKSEISNQKSNSKIKLKQSQTQYVPIHKWFFIIFVLLFVWFSIV